MCDNVLRTAAVKPLKGLLRSARAAFCDTDIAFLVNDRRVYEKATTVGQKYKFSFYWMPPITNVPEGILDHILGTTMQRCIWGNDAIKHCRGNGWRNGAVLQKMPTRGEVLEAPHHQ